MRILFKIILFTLLLPVSGLFAMEYGDMPQSCVGPATSWLYDKCAGWYVASCSEAKASIAPTVQASTFTIPRNVALGIAGGALTLWSIKKIYMNKLYKNNVALSLAGGAVSLCTAWIYFKSNNGE